MKRYLIFDYDRYYPGGGFNDLRTIAGTVEEIKAEIDGWKNEDYPSDFLDVVDTYSMKHIFRAEIDYGRVDVRVDKMGED